MAANSNPFAITHEFDAPVEKVFAAWTEPEQLKQWYAPKDYSILFAKADIKPGGSTHYCMISEHGLELWYKLFYQEVIPPAKLSYTQVFSNEEGNIKPHPMILDWPLEVATTVMLDEKHGKTCLEISWEPVNASIKEITKFSDGFHELGQEWLGTLKQLETFLENQQ